MNWWTDEWTNYQSDELPTRQTDMLNQQIKPGPTLTLKQTPIETKIVSR